ncbi:MAG: UDP-N-acetylmuramoyl-L-alanine--D-glutamate ligase [Candidatus Vogelbacteria bacterium]
MDYRDYFRDKKITLMGLGLLGRGVGDAKFLARAVAPARTERGSARSGGDLIVTDLKSAKELTPSLKKLTKLQAITYVLGEHRLEDFRNRDLIIKGAGVPLDSPYIAEAKKNKIPVMMSAALFVKFTQSLGVKIIGVTGTRGKTTVTSLIYEILKHYCQCQGLPLTSKKVWLGGNVLGVSTLALLPKVKPGDFVVLELDSWQLQGFGDLGISPPIAVFTNFMPDHLNYYKGDMKAYLADKENIFKYQKPKDHLVRGEKVKKLSKSWKLKILGEHNRTNAACAVAVARILEIPEKLIKQTVENFIGVPGRLELIRTWRGIKIYNDTTSTTPEATVVALRALGVPRRRSGQNQNVILILGGADKNLPLDILVKTLPKYCQEIILLPGTGTEKLRRLLSSKVGAPTEASGLKEAVDLAFKIARSGDTIILSPGFASFGLFKNEYDRGAQFVKLVKNLK